MLLFPFLLFFCYSIPLFNITHIWSTWYGKPYYAKEDFPLYRYQLKTERTLIPPNHGPMKHEIVVLFIPSYSHSSHPSSTLFPHTQRRVHALVPFVCSFLYSSSIFLHYTQYFCISIILTYYYYDTYHTTHRHPMSNTENFYYIF